jgi:hypothetical protein
MGKNKENSINNLEQLKHLEFNVYEETDGDPQLYGADDDEGLEGDGEGA